MRHLVRWFHPGSFGSLTRTLGLVGLIIGRLVYPVRFGLLVRIQGVLELSRGSLVHTAALCEVVAFTRL